MNIYKVIRKFNGFITQVPEAFWKIKLYFFAKNIFIKI